VGTLITFLGVGAISWVWSTGIATKDRVEYLSNLNDNHVAEVAEAKFQAHDKAWETKVDDKFTKQTADLTAVISKTKTDLETEIQAKK
jgi:hypothetical protein